MAERIRDRGNRITGALVMIMMLMPATDALAARARRGTHAPARSSAHAGRTRRASAGRVAAPRPGSAFECDTPKGAEWYGSTERCLRELCAGGNVTNRYVDGQGGRLRRNPCYGRDPYELER